jgi:hypothetical protein
MVSSSGAAAKYREPITGDTVLYPRRMEIPNKLVYNVIVMFVTQLVV